MNASRTGLIALVLWASGLAISGVSAVLLIASISTPVPDIWGFRGFTIPIALSFATVGAIVARRQPANAIGWFFCVGGLLAAVQGFIEEYVIAGVLAAPGSLPATTLAAQRLRRLAAGGRLQTPARRRRRRRDGVRWSPSRPS